MQIEGLLSRFSLRDLLDLCVASMVNGTLEIDSPAGTARLFFVEGQCVHAESPESTGFEAIWPLFELADAPFRFVAGVLTTQRTVVAPTADTIARAEAIIERWARIRPHISDLKLVPMLVVPADSEQVRIFEEDWPVLSCVDGARTIAEIARRAVLDPSEVCEALLRLRERGLVSLEKQSASHTSAAPIDPSELPALAESSLESLPLTQRERFFARLLATVPAAAIEESDPWIPAEPVEPDDILQILRT